MTISERTALVVALTVSCVTVALWAPWPVQTMVLVALVGLLSYHFVIWVPAYRRHRQAWWRHR